MNKRILPGLVLIEMMFVFDYAVSWGIETNSWLSGLKFWFDMDAEGNLPALFSALQLAAIGVAWFLVARARVLNVPRAFPVLLGIVFMLLALDEFFVLHERVRGLLRIVRNAAAPELYVGVGAWIPVYLLGAVVLAATTAPFWVRLWQQARKPLWFLVLGGTVFLSGAVILEIVSYRALSILNSALGYQIEVATEEFLEMLGASLILYGVLELYSGINRPRAVSMHRAQQHVTRT